MADHRQYLRLRLLNADYLLPGASGFAIEKREALEVNPEGGLIAAWRNQKGTRSPAFSLDAELNPVSRSLWQRAIFLQATGQTVGLVADELQLLTREDVRVEPFQPLGQAPTRVGHLFSGAWVRSGHMPMLVFEPAVLASWLKMLETRL